MNRIKYITLACFLALVILGIVTYIINVNVNKSYVKVAVVNANVATGEKISDGNINWIKIESSKLNIDNYITEKNIKLLSSCVAGVNIDKGQLVWKNSLINEEEYLEKKENMEYIALPVKSATEGVCYKLKKGDIISVYYTAKKKLVDSVIKDRKKIYSVATTETLVTCLLYENLEIIAMTNNTGQDTTGANITDIVVRLTQEQAMELANLKEQGTFTIAIK